MLKLLRNCAAHQLHEGFVFKGLDKGFQRRQLGRDKVGMPALFHVDGSGQHRDDGDDAERSSHGTVGCLAGPMEHALE